MSKKQKNNKETKQVAKIVDEQREPCLRAIQKKVRNINKRLNEIADLQKKNDLKPEQIEKIERKPMVQQQRDKYSEFLKLYQEIVTENQNAYQQWKLSEIREIAEVIVAYQYGFQNGNSAAEKLVQTLQRPSSEGLTLDQRLQEITEAMNSVAENTKLKSKVKKFNEENPLKLLLDQKERQNESESQNNLPLVTKQTLKEEEKTEQKPQPIKQVIHQHHQEHKEESVINDVPSEKKVEETEQPKQQSQAPQQAESKVEEKQQAGGNQEKAAQQNKQGESPQNDKRRKYQNNRGRRDQGRRNFNNSRREGDNKEGGQRRYRDRNERPNNKKKYQQKNPNNTQEKENEDDSSSLEKTPEAREFKREQVRELIEDGFIVVGKPKPKAHDQKQYHERTHGRKNHHHHKKENY